MRLAVLALIAPLASGCSLVESFDGYVKDGASNEKSDAKSDTATAEDTSGDPDEGAPDEGLLDATVRTDTAVVPTDTGTLADTKETCPSGQTPCGTGCVTTATDPNNCGGCGVVCSATKGLLSICNGGTCGCPSDTTLCSGKCVRTATDPMHCGGCGLILHYSEQCVAGNPVCRPGTVQCVPWTTTMGSSVTCVDECTDIRGDGWHCVDPDTGSKSRCYSDTAASRCISGDCFAGVACPAGRTECPTALTNSRSCFSLSNDANHCGGCTFKCGPGDLCIGGSCVKYRVAKACSECVVDGSKCCSGTSVPSSWDHKIVCVPAASSCPS